MSLDTAVGSWVPAPRQGQLSRDLERDGYLHVPALGVGHGDVQQVRDLLDPLFDRFTSLPADLAQDLAPVPGAVLELNHALRVEPRLRETEVFRAAFALARRLLGNGCWLTFDHAIYKPPGRSAPTSWHQDAAYSTRERRGVAIWVPLQDTGVEDGCMQYVPGSHLRGRLPHVERELGGGTLLKHLPGPFADAVPVPCRVGGATVHAQRTVHGAGPNLGGEVRRAWILDFATGPVPVRLLHHANAARGWRRPG